MRRHGPSSSRVAAGTSPSSARAPVLPGTRTPRHPVLMDRMMNQPLRPRSATSPSRRVALPALSNRTAWVSTACLLAAAWLLSVPARAADVANPFAELASWSRLLGDPSLQAKLKLTAERAEQLQQLLAGAPTAEAGQKLVAAQLAEPQLRTLRKAAAQAEGGYALFDPQMAKYLSLTKEQQTQLEAVAKENEALAAEMRDFMRRARFRSREAMEEYVQGYLDKASERLLACLTDAQRDQWMRLFRP